MEAHSSRPLTLEEINEIVTRVVAVLMHAQQALEPHLVYLTPEQRKATSKPPRQLNDSGRQVASTSKTVPHLLAACPGFDGPKVIHGLEMAEILAPLAEHAEMLAQLAADTRNQHLSDAYTATLELYRVGKAMGVRDAKIREVIQPLAELFTNRKKSARDGEPK